MTQLSAMPTVSRLVLHRETVLNLAGGRTGEAPARTRGDWCTYDVQCTWLGCTVTCKHCTKKPGGCLA